MTTRSDVEVTYVTSPRVAEVQAPSTEIIMQDLVDTLRKEEDSFEGMVFKKLINASGKEDLGGGVSVGITVAMQNLLLAFQGRTTPAQTGNVTATPASPVPSRQIFQDSSATFIANGVQRGSLVVNFTDQSIADVVSVDSETQLTTKVLAEGIGNTYDINDDYKVWNIIQVQATGGNLTAVDEFQAAISAILPTAFTQVILQSSSSATLQELPEVRDIHGQVRRSIFIDTNAVVNGNGYQQTPYNNWADAVDDAEANNITSLHLEADATVDRQIKNFEIYGQGLPQLDFNGQIMDGSTIRLCNVTGTQGGTGKMVLFDCQMNNVVDFDGAGSLIGLVGTLSFRNGSTPILNQLVQFTVAPGTLDLTLGGAATQVEISNVSGEFVITNMDNAGDVVHMHIDHGEITIAASCTAGTIHLSGNAKVIDNSAGTTVEVSALLEPEDLQLAKALLEADHFFDKTGGLLHYYYKGTTTDIIPAKTVSGEQVTNNVTLTE